MFGGTGFGQAAKTTGSTGFTFPAATTTTPGTTLFGQQAQPGMSTGFTGFGFPTTSTAQTPSQQGGGFQIPSSTPSLSSSLLNKPLATTGFGLPQTTTAAPLATTGFGLPQTSAAQPAATGFGFTAPKTSAPTALAPTTAATAGFSFGFGQTTTAAPTLLGTTTTSTPTAASTAAPTLNFNLGASTAATATTAATGLTFGLGISTTTTTSATAPALPFGLGSTQTSTPSFGLTTTTTAAATTSGTPSLGLGGTTSFTLGKGTTLATSTDQLKANPLTSLTPAPNQPQAPNYKDEFIPAEMMTLIESFKTFVKEQKSASSVVNRASLKQISKVTEDAELLKRMTMQLERTVNKNKALNKMLREVWSRSGITHFSKISKGIERKLREDVARGIQDSEVVQRLSMDPRGYPIDNSLAFEYFRNIVDRFQLQAEALTVELKNMEKHIVCKLNPSPFTPEELSAIMKQLYECFVALAGRYQSIHSSVTSLKLEMQRKNDPWYSINSQRVSALDKM